MSYKISIIITCYNSEKYLIETLKSIEIQTYQNYEVVIVNDGSIDRTEDIVKNSSLPIIYYKQTNKGISAARNKGLELSSGEIIMLLDHDDLLYDENSLKTAVKEFESNKELSVLHSRLAVINEYGEVIGYNFYSEFNNQYDYLAMLFYRSYLFGTGLFFKRECINKVGFFDETKPVGEDYDYILRLLSNEYKIKILYTPLVRYQRTGNNTSKIGYNAIYKGRASIEIERDILLKYDHEFIKNVYKRSSFPGDEKYSMAGIVFLRRGNTELAINEFNEAIKHNPFNLDARFCLGVIYLEKNDIQEALEQYHILIENNINRPDVYNNYGVALILNGNTETGTNFIKQANIKNPNYIDARENLKLLNDKNSHLKITPRPLRENAYYFI